MRIALAVLIALVAAAPAQARGAEPITMGQAKAATGAHALIFAQMLSAGPSGYGRVGRCDRRSESVVRCRFAAHGDQTCRGWNYSRLSGDEYIVWFQAVVCR